MSFYLRFPRFCWCLLFTISLTVASGTAQETRYKYQPSPPDNPLKGLVPYAGQGDPFPHSMEFWYFSMREIMTGPTKFDWKGIEKKLDEIASRNCQAIIRVYMEYPGKPIATPKFLVDRGVKIEKYKHGDDLTHTPDYDDPKTQKAMVDFVTAYGKKYDGDPRIGFITMGILGQWGEWHTYPRDELFASKQTQAKVMDAFEKSFVKTKVLMRYPAGNDTWQKAPNHLRPFGYHDDSFAWATLETGKEEDDWFYVPALKKAGEQALKKWETQPIGGEIRPEIWGCVFDNPSCAPKGQEFDKCVQATHASWLMDSGMFSLANPKPTKQRKKEAIRQIRKMGYELFVEKSVIALDGDRLSVEITVENRGVAPFYYDWPIEIIVAGENNRPSKTLVAKWDLSDAMPGKKTVWKTEIGLQSAGEKPKVSLRVVNPLKNGKPFLFANETQSANGILALN